MHRLQCLVFTAMKSIGHKKFRNFNKFSLVCRVMVQQKFLDHIQITYEIQAREVAGLHPETRKIKTKKATKTVLMVPKMRLSP